MKSLLRRFDRDPEFELQYCKAIQLYIDEGYATRVSDSISTDRQWFISHSGVVKKSDATGKLRVVFDSAVEFQGKSLNKALLTRPPLQNKLPSVMLRFRQRAVAICADIAMFYRIRLTKDDAQFPRFLWTEKGSQEILTFQMNRLTFGDASSPIVAISTLRWTARDRGGDDARAIGAINKNFYVDDILDSTDTPEEAIQLGRRVESILANGDFHLGNGCPTLRS